MQEYLTSLLLDASFLPFIMKYFNVLDPEKAMDNRVDREELGFFHFCKITSKNNDVQPADPESEDDCAPPPIKRQRDLPVEQDPIEMTEMNAALPEFLENDAGDLCTVYSSRNFFSTINYLKVLRKITKGKAHRNLMMVNYKSAPIIKKVLFKAPQPLLRLLCLKLMKPQFPFCGRKWRAQNMKVLTLIYEHVRPELNDDWLIGGDRVETTVDEAVPLERAMRALTHYYNVKHYGKEMGVNQEELARQNDFFVRELRKLGFSWGVEEEEEEEFEGPVMIDAY
jgi:Domain of unknown function (DUF3402)